ncbi:3-phenylpropionate/trans-cinnamate dioxygenase ferredoxin reductase subunit [Pseudomonas taetrolens]|uniref:3-phenylpropionate/trans-cinnamate dioxygenase ferredoxin reductase subunit n=1 Tax=Pseudomonas taetrolens TaxID=47884 RepID=A0A0J6GLG4_PSETA|nr:FAD-dependent oxidoreductase [Pseudomonas taetrolens]KMM85521.1 pyridine nucleotide-disulfide oxidoreductase [Pseudomonas taetrolens]SEC24208.1 3-phenylpropionate/trans-cinnamate dioxygenase ferredoxin reductase subunit [Pseudomonas taetrolens]SQF86207.1 pyridine nucleotide-disulfide oxidoreductase domain-containing protein [Pseudomonas taetrolens]VEH49283.1 pyridine nucleotide-disulfide oxidoreductase domain-containing protein [Pseudomonas taetrolens]
MNSLNAPLVIVGAGHAGGRAALTLRAEGYSGRLILLGDEPHAPYERPPLSKGLLRGTTDLAGCGLCDSVGLAGLQIEHWVDNPVQRIDPAGHRVQLADGSWLPYAGLLLTTGGRARRLANVPAALGNVLYLRTHDEALALRTVLRPGARVVIIGGGFIGLEVAATARDLGCSVIVLEAGPRLAGRVLPERLSSVLLALHRSQGVDVRLNVEVEAVLGRDVADSVQLVDGERLGCDLVVVGIGMQPNIELAAAAGLDVGQGIRVDARLRTSAADIFAAGDVCEFQLHPQGAFQRQETWRNAEQQGRHAALNLLGADLPFEAVPGFWSDHYDWSLQTVGVLDNTEPAASRSIPGGGFLMFWLDAQHRLQGACGWGQGNSIARDIKLCERLIVQGNPLVAQVLADADVSLKQVLRG